MNDSPPSDEFDLERRLTERHEFLVKLVRRRASRSVLAMESPEDLAQDICVHVLAMGDCYEAREGASFDAWLQRVAQNVLADRHKHFRALKRDGARVLRMAFSESTGGGFDPVRDLAASVTGPSTFAIRREQLTLAGRALDTLLARDRRMIEGLCLGRTSAEEAAELELSVEVASQARRRALDRFRRAFRIVVQGQER